MGNIEELEDFTYKMKEGLREIGLIKQEEKLKIIKNTKGFNWEISLLGDPEKQIDRTMRIINELNKRLG